MINYKSFMANKPLKLKKNASQDESLIPSILNSNNNKKYKRNLTNNNTGIETTQTQSNSIRGTYLNFSNRRNTDYSSVCMQTNSIGERANSKFSSKVKKLPNLKTQLNYHKLNSLKKRDIENFFISKPRLNSEQADLDSNTHSNNQYGIETSKLFNFKVKRNPISRKTKKGILYTNLNIHPDRRSNAEILNLLHRINDKRSSMNEDYIKITFKNFNRQKASIIAKWKEVIKILQSIHVKLALYTLKLLGDLYIEMDEFELAKSVYHFYKFLTYNLGFIDEFPRVYESIGNCYKYLNNYKKAIKCFKKQIEVSWALNHKESELRAYDLIGLQHYYLGDRTKAKFYHNKSIEGANEPVKSELRERIVKNFKERHFQFFQPGSGSKSNEELMEDFKDIIGVYEKKKIESMEDVDIIKTSEELNFSMISNIDVSFVCVNNEVDYHEFDIFKESKTRQLKHKNLLNRLIKAEHDKDLEDETILSHLSNKRKNFFFDRFEKIFLEFDLKISSLIGMYKGSTYNTSVLDDKLILIK